MYLFKEVSTNLYVVVVNFSVKNLNTNEECVLLKKIEKEDSHIYMLSRKAFVENFKLYIN